MGWWKGHKGYITQKDVSAHIDNDGSTNGSQKSRGPARSVDSIKIRMMMGSRMIKAFNTVVSASFRIPARSGASPKSILFTDERHMAPLASSISGNGYGKQGVSVFIESPMVSGSPGRGPLCPSCHPARLPVDTVYGSQFLLVFHCFHQGNILIITGVRMDSAPFSLSSATVDWAFSAGNPPGCSYIYKEKQYPANEHQN